jgi:hypothetical protein
VRARGPVLTNAALDAIVDSANAHLAGEEGEGDLAGTRFADLRRARDWAVAERERRAERKERRKTRA